MMPPRIPALPPLHAARPHLVDSVLTTAYSHRVLVLHAPAGYGKTVLLSECLARQTNPVLYFRLDRRHQDPAALMQLIFQGLHGLEPAPTEPVEAAGLAMQQMASSLLSYAYTLANGSEAVWLVLDNYHQAETEAINHQLEDLIERLPETFRVVISSRGQPDLPLMRWEVEGRVATFTTEQLRLTSPEVAQLGSMILERPLDPVEVELLERCFKGWSLGVTLTAQLFRGQPRREFVRALKEDGGLTSKLAAYLEQEVVRGQFKDPHELDLMCRSSILSELGIDVCNDLLDIPYAGTLLQRLSMRGLFIGPLDELATIYGIHPLFRRFLQDRLSRTFNRAMVQALHRKAAQIYHQRQRWIRSITHYLQAEDYTAVAEILTEVGSSLLATPEAQIAIPYLRPSEQRNPVTLILDWLDALPQSILETYPRLLVLQGQALLSLGDCTTAYQVIERARERLDAHESGTDRGWATVTLANIEAGLGHHREALALLEGLRESVQWETSLYAQVLLSQCASHYAMGEFTAALEAGEEALRLVGDLTGREARSIEMQVSRHLALVHLDMGRLDLAQAIAELAWMICTEHHVGTLTQREANVETYVQVQVALGQFEAARSMITHGGSALDGSTGPLTSPALITAQGTMATVEQDYAQAERLLDEAGQSVWPVIHLKVVKGELDEARRRVELELTTLQTDQATTGVSVRQHHAGITWLGVIEAQLGQTQEALAHLNAAIHFFTAQGLEAWRAGAELHLAWLLSRLGKRTQARHVLARAVNYGAQMNALTFAFWHPEVIAYACAEALNAAIEPTYVVALASRLKPVQARYFQPLLQHSSRDIQGHAATILERLGAPRGESRSRPRPALPPASPKTDGRLTAEGRAKLATYYMLTPREVDVLSLYLDPDVRGEATRVNDAIAAQLSLSSSTVRDYISTILKKLGVPGRDRLRLQAWAIDQKIVRN